MADASDQDTMDALSNFDPTQSLFVYGIRYAYRNDRPSQLRKAALFSLPIISDKWFNAPEPIMDADQIRKRCLDWASSVESVEHTHDVQKAAVAVLFGMINSPHW